MHHYAVLASARRGVKLSAARLALQMPVLNPMAVESAQGFMARLAKIDVMLCHCCNMGKLRVVEGWQAKSD